MALFMDRTRAFGLGRRLEWLSFRFVNGDFKVKEAIDLGMVRRCGKRLKEGEDMERYKYVSIYG